MIFLRFFKGCLVALMAVVIATAVFIFAFGWNWLRQPIEQYTLDKTGRELAIKGDLTLGWHWPPRIAVEDISFANPLWAVEPELFKASSADIEVDLFKLLEGRFVFPQVHLVNAIAFLERNSDGRKSWLLDLQQQYEGARIEIGRITLDQAKLGYDDITQKTRVRAEISSITPQDPASPYALGVTAEGQFKGNAGQFTVMQGGPQPRQTADVAASVGAGRMPRCESASI